MTSNLKPQTSNTLPRDARIYIAGHRGLVGSGIWRAFERRGYSNLIGRSHRELDLTCQQAVQEFYEGHREHVMEKLHLSSEAAKEYVDGQRDALLFGGVQAMTNWEQERVDWLVARMMEGKSHED